VTKCLVIVMVATAIEGYYSDRGGRFSTLRQKVTAIIIATAIDDYDIAVKGDSDKRRQRNKATSIDGGGDDR